MIAHVVLFRPSKSMSGADKEAFVAALERAFSNIPEVERARVGRRRLLGRFYDAHAAEQFEFAAVLEFATEQALRVYLDHPAHVELGQRFFASADAALVHDFEMVDGAQVRSIVEL